VALGLYNGALKTSSGIEYSDGIAINLLNMAAVYRRLGDRENAQKCLDRIFILNGRGVPFAASDLSDAAFMKAILFTDGGEYRTAIEWTDRALNFCAGGPCRHEGKIYNLKARIELLGDDVSAALRNAALGLELNKKSGDRQEKANSLRLLAGARALAGQYQTAEGLYKAALTIDKDLGQGLKIEADLQGIGAALLKQGKYTDAENYYRRAMAVGRALDDTKDVQASKALIGICETGGRK
jgi:tetratricopeptide (TPR) repeat protein